MTCQGSFGGMFDGVGCDVDPDADGVKSLVDIAGSSSAAPMRPGEADSLALWPSLMPRYRPALTVDSDSTTEDLLRGRWFREMIARPELGDCGV